MVSEPTKFSYDELRSVAELIARFRPGTAAVWYLAILDEVKRLMNSDDYLSLLRQAYVAMGLRLEDADPGAPRSNKMPRPDETVAMMTQDEFRRLWLNEQPAGREEGDDE